MEAVATKINKNRQPILKVAKNPTIVVKPRPVPRFTVDSLRVADARTGRPKLWNDPEQLGELIDNYFEDCRELGRPYTISGLAVWTGCDRSTLVNYAAKDVFLPVIKRARSVVEMYLEDYLLSGKPPIGAIFIAKNNFGWKDRNEVDVMHTFDMARLQGVLDNRDKAIEGEIAGN
mgnify:CR=1 FL=1